MTGWPLLSLTIFLPIVGAILIFPMRGDASNGRALQAGLGVATLTFILSLIVLARFDHAVSGYQLADRAPWFESLGITYYVAVDGISVWFVSLTAFLTIIALSVARFSVTRRIKGLVVTILVLETLVIGAFCALDLLLFYIFFEGTLIPSFVLIGVWGLERRIYAAFKFFLFTLLGSLAFLICIIAMYLQVGTMDIPTLSAFHFDPGLQRWLWLAMFICFAVKMPLWPFHTWVPDAYAEGPMAATVMLAGIVSKLGAYGFLRFSLPMLPDASAHFAPLIDALSVIGIVYASLVALMQRNMKRLIAYSSIAHMGFVTIGCFTFNTIGLDGALVQMISHGLVIAALFICAGIAYSRTGSYEITACGGFARMPIFASFFVFFIMASIAVPGTSSFIGEIMVIVSSFQTNGWVAALAATSMVLGATYMLWLGRRVIFGAATHPALDNVRDIRTLDGAILAVLALLILGLGVYPSAFIGTVAGPVNAYAVRLDPAPTGRHMHAEGATPAARPPA